MNRHSSMWLTAYEKDGSSQSGYRFVITNGAMAYTAFHTIKGLNDFMRRFKGKLHFVSKSAGSERWPASKHYRITGEVLETYFWKLSELPEGATCFKGLCNGGLVDCYYHQTPTGCTIYRPNPNAKDIYKPLPLDEHIAYQRING